MQEPTTKRSRQREKIFQALRRTQSHPTAEWIFKEVRQEIPKISLGTVYRNLNVLRRQGRILELDFGEGIRRYDAVVQPHYHFMCSRCGMVCDIDIPPIEVVTEQARTTVPGIVDSHRLDYIGTCNTCLEHS